MSISCDHDEVSSPKMWGEMWEEACITALHYISVQPNFLSLKDINYIPVIWAISRLQFRSRELRKKESGVGPIGEETVVEAVDIAWLTFAAVPSEINGFKICLWVD